MTKPTTIRTKRLLLRPFAFKDVNDVQAYASDPRMVALRTRAGSIHAE